MLSEQYRWSIYRILKFPEAAKTPLWAKLDIKEVDTGWSAEVIRIVDLLVAGESNPNTLYGSTKAYKPGLKQADVLHWFEGLADQKLAARYSQLWQDLMIMIGRAEIMCELPVHNCANSSNGAGFGFGFS